MPWRTSRRRISQTDAGTRIWTLYGVYRCQYVRLDVVGVERISNRCQYARQDVIWQLDNHCLCSLEVTSSCASMSTHTTRFKCWTKNNFFYFVLQQGAPKPTLAQLPSCWFNFPVLSVLYRLHPSRLLLCISGLLVAKCICDAKLL